jgi:hypothetical protein
MKTLIATALVLATGIVNAQSFDFEKAVGSAELYSTLATESVSTVNSASSNFAYQVDNGSHDLFSFTDETSQREGIVGDRTAFEYQLNVGSPELDPSLS